MRKRLIGFAIGLAVLGLGAFGFNAIFEIVPDENYFYPSAEAQANRLLALERWLASGGISVRTDSSASDVSLMTAEENIIMIESGLVAWNSETISALDSRVQYGDHLVLSLNYWGRNEGPLDCYLESVGVKFSDEEIDWSSSGDENYNGPIFSEYFSFEEPENACMVLKDRYGLIRLVQVERGEGTITVTDGNRFMTNSNIQHEANARLCWYLFSGSKSASVFFVCGEPDREGVVGGLFGHENFFMIVIAGLILIVVGFWAAIPVFGVVRGDEKNGKPLAERFLAEGRFLRRFNSLDVYRSVYIRQIKRKLAKRNFHDDDENAKRARKILADYEENTAAESVSKKRPLAKNEFVKSITVWKTILERL